MMTKIKAHNRDLKRLSREGFTIVELLIGLATGMVAIAGAVAAYSSLSASYTAETARAAAQQDIRSAMAVMVQDIRMAGLDPLGTAGAGFTTTDADDIEFIADLDYDGSLGSSERIRYFLNGSNLVQELDDDSDTGEVLLGNISSLSFSYDDTDDPAQVTISITVQKNAGKKGSVSRSLTELVRIRNE